MEKRKYFKEIFIDKDNEKYSFTKFLAFGGHIFLCVFFVVALKIMHDNSTIDHILLGELLGYILTLSGYKNSFGFKKTKKDGSKEEAKSEAL